jgi:ATP-dependent DNA ligase
MGARQHPTRALAAFDRLLPWQMETAVFIPPMLATRLEDPRRLADARYIAEPKLDGQRAQLHVRGVGRSAVTPDPGY